MKGTNVKKKKLFSLARLVFYMLSILVFYLAIHYVGKLEDIRMLLMEMNPSWLFLAIAAQVATYFFNALVLYTLLEREVGNASFFTLFKMSIVIIFINQALPSGGLSGNGYVFNQFVKRKVEVSRVFRALVLESMCYYAAMIISLVFFYYWYSQLRTATHDVIRYTVFGGIVFFVFLGVVMVIISNQHTIAFIKKKLGRIRRIKRYIDDLEDSSSMGRNTELRRLFRKKTNILLAVLFQLCLIGCDIITAFAIVKGLHVQLPFMHVSFGLLLSMVIGALPLSPGSLIAYEGAMTYFLNILGAPVHVALVVTLIFRFLSFWLPMPVGLLLYRNLQNSNVPNRNE